MRSIFSGLIASSVLLLVGCGGGGGGNKPPVPTPPQAQSITFTNAGPVSRPLSDGTFTNAASGGAGTGAITYQSSNAAVATVNASGVVTFVAAGSTTITANKAADAAFLAASASYTLTLTAPPVAQPQTIAFATSGPVTRPLTGGSFTNVASGGAGTGAITYQSSNTAVATVNASGVVTFVAAGSTTITANKAADAGFLAASANYMLTITAPVVPQPQAIAFATAGPVTRPLTDGSYTNVASGGAGTGTITYLSSNAAVAAVSNAGVVTFVVAGTVTITASKAADANYLAATASYSLTITSPPAPQPQTIAFANAGPVSRPLTDGSFVNGASGGAGTGAISYQSSNTAVATVAGAGVVTFVTAGTVTITASKAADANYLAATASYSLTITSPVAGTAAVTAWVGEFNTQVSFPAAANGLEFLRTTQLDCDVAQFTTCANHQSSVVGSSPMLDTAARLTRDAMWWLRSGATASAPMKISLQRFGPRAAPTVGSFHGKLWVVGGSEWDSPNYVPVWNSDDGVNWTPVTTFGGASFGSRAQLVEFNDRLYLIGGEGSQFGYVDDLYKDEVKSSADGITWTVVTLDAPWPGRYGHSSFVFNNRIWVVGGTTHSTDGNDAWSSADGLNWVAETTDGPFRGGALATVMNGRIWVVGGWDGAFSTSVYSSEDGRTWRTETTTAPFPGRSGAVFQALNGRLYLAAGQNDPNNGRANDVWSSADGIDWVEEAHEAPFMPRYSQGSTVHAGRIWVIGGDFRNPQPTVSGLDVYYTNDVWSTSNGSIWREHSPHAGAFQASAPEALAANGRIWIVGGNNMLSVHEEIASSADGGQWTPAPAGARFSRRGGKGLVWFGNELWISGGATGTDNLTQFADVWHSADGGSWTRATQTAPFGERYAHTMVTFNGQMYVIGGVSGTTTLGDVWRSSDGVNWTLAAAAPFDPRYRGRAVVFGGRLWIFGGTNDTGPLSDAWSTADGTTWRLETATVAPLPRYGFMLTAHAGRLFISGGSTLTGGLVHYDDVWSSADGIAWTQVTAGPRFTPRRLHGFLSFDNKLWVLGGVDAKYPYNDIWSSDDNGVNWRMRYASELRLP